MNCPHCGKAIAPALLAQHMGREMGRRGGEARRKLAPAERRRLAREAAQKRWAKRPSP